MPMAYVVTSVPSGGHLTTILEDPSKTHRKSAVRLDLAGAVGHNVGPGTLKAPAAWMSEVGQSGEDENYVGVFGGFFEVLFWFGGAGKSAEERKATASPNVRPLHSRQPSRFSLELAPISAPTSANKTIYQL